MDHNTQKQSTTSQEIALSSEQTQIIQKCTQALGVALSEVPWMKFKVIAEPDMTLFASDTRLPAFIKQITQTTVSIVSEQIMEEFKVAIHQLLASITQTVATRMTTVQTLVIQQVTAMTSLAGISSMTKSQTLGPITPPLKDGGHGPAIPFNECPALYPDQTAVIISPPDLCKAHWIWTKEIIIDANPDRSTRPFRKVIDLKCPVNHATIDIACDNYYTLYVNGKVVGSGKQWNKPDRYTVQFSQTTKVEIAVYAAQEPGAKQPVGLIAAGRVWHSQERSPKGHDFSTDASWKTISADKFSPNFIQVGFVDSAWEHAHIQAIYGQGVWKSLAPVEAGRMPKLRLTSASAPGVEDAPKAPEADIVAAAHK